VELDTMLCNSILRLYQTRPAKMEKFIDLMEEKHIKPGILNHWFREFEF
jgi:hypothetical protein